jgi:hypothetical protein
VGFKEMESKGAGWINLAQDSDMRQYVVNLALISWIS